MTKVRQLLSAYTFPRDCGAKERDNVPLLPFHIPIAHNLFQIFFFTVFYREHLKVQNRYYFVKQRVDGRNELATLKQPLQNAIGSRIILFSSP